MLYMHTHREKNTYTYSKSSLGSYSSSVTLNLVGKQLEVCWPYKVTKDGKKKTAKIWASGRVVRIADGLTDAKGKKKKLLPVTEQL